MLERIRKKMASFFVKIILFVLIASFALWGITDVLTGRTSSNIVASVGEYDISLQRLENNFRTVANRAGYSELNSENISVIMRQALFDDVIRALFSQGALDLGVSVSDDILRQALLQMVEFHDENGRFSKAIFEALLYQGGMTETEYFSALRQQIEIEMFSKPLSRGMLVPDRVVNALHGYANKRITASYIMVSPDEMDLPAIDDEALLSWYEENPELYMTQEYRSFDVISFSFEEISKMMEISEEALVEVYENDPIQYFIPVRRVFTRYLFNTEKEAREGLERLRIDEEALFDNAMIHQLLPLRETELSDDIGEEVFLLGIGEFSSVLETPVGWVIMRYDEEIEERQVLFEEARDGILTTLRLEAADDYIYDDLMPSVENFLSAGMPFSEIADDLDISLLSFRVDSRGYLENGEGPEEFVDRGLFPVVESVFALPEEGEHTDLMFIEENSLWYSVYLQDIEPAELLVFEDVQERVQEDYTVFLRRKMAKEAADDFSVQLKEGEILQKNGSPVVWSTVEFTRFDSTDVPFDNNLLQRIFTFGAVDEILRGRTKEEEEAVLVIERSVDALESDFPERRAEIKDNLQGEYVSRLEYYLRRILEEKHPIDIREERMQQLVDLYTPQEE